MKLEKLREERKKNRLTFLMKDSDEVFANTIRRLILEEVPTLAVEDVEIKDNNSALYDEMLALRLGLVPIKTDLDSYVLKSKCKCNGAGCAQCELKITLKSNKKGYVLAEEALSADPKCTFVYPNMLIVKLLSKQKVDVTMTAVLGQGKDHVKWVPALSFYKKELSIKVGKVADPKKLVESCPLQIFKLSGSKVEVDKEKMIDCHNCMQCADLDKEVAIEETGNLIFVVESWGQLSCKDILTQSTEILIQKVEEMENLI